MAQQKQIGFTMTLSIHDICSKAEWFLYGIKEEGPHFCFVKTTRERLDELAFHDGRTPIRMEPTALLIPVTDALTGRQEKDTNNPRATRLIVHISFCASTLLARALNSPRSLSYREPRIFAQLSSMKFKGHPLSKNDDLWQSILEFSFAQFRKTWYTDQKAFVKPSNWANRLLLDLNDIGQHRCVFLTMPAREYVIANLRGGQSRIRYSIDLLNHMAHEDRKLRSIVESIDRSRAPASMKLVKMLTVLYEAQSRLIKRLRARLNSRQYVELTKKTLLAEPVSSLETASRALGLDLSTDQIQRNIEEHFAVHAKEVERVAFSRAAEEDANLRLEEQFRDEIAVAADFGRVLETDS